MAKRIRENPENAKMRREAQKDGLRQSAAFYVPDFDPTMATEARMVWTIGMMYYYLMRRDKSYMDVASFLQEYTQRYKETYYAGTSNNLMQPSVYYQRIQKRVPNVLHLDFFDGSIRTLEAMMARLDRQDDLDGMGLTVDDFDFEDDPGAEENDPGNGGYSKKQFQCSLLEGVELSIFKIVKQPSGTLRLLDDNDVRWKRMDTVGSGNGGTVTIYQDPTNDKRQVALKKYKRPDDKEIALLENFDDKGCQVVGIRLLPHRNTRFSVMQLARGDMYPLLAKTSTVARKVCYDMCNIYACMKKQTGLLYGDIKLENLLFTCDPLTKNKMSFFAGDIGGFRREGERGDTTHPPPIPYDHVFLHDVEERTTIAYSKVRCWLAVQRGVHPDTVDMGKEKTALSNVVDDAFAATTGDVLALIAPSIVEFDVMEVMMGLANMLRGGGVCSHFRKTIDPKCAEQEGCTWIVGAKPGCQDSAASREQPKHDFVLKKEKETLETETQWFIQEDDQGILEEVDDEVEADFILHDVRGDGNCFHYALLRASKAKERKPGVTRVSIDPRIETLTRKGELIKPVLNKTTLKTYKNLYENLFPLVARCRAFQEPSFQANLELAMITFGKGTREEEAFIQNLTKPNVYIQYVPGVHEVLFRCLFDIKIRVYWEGRGWVGVYADEDPTDEDVVNLYYDPEHFQWLEPIDKKKKPPAAAEKKKKPVHVGKKEFDEITVMQYKELKPRTVLGNPQKSLEKYDQWFASEKIDGWQAIWDGQGTLYTKMYKQTFSVPQYWLDLLPKGVALAGEIKIQGEQATKTAALMKESPLWATTYFHVFDILGVDRPFRERVEIIKETVHVACSSIEGCPLIAAPQIQLRWEDILVFYEQVLQEGGEGLVLTDPNSLYDSSGKRSASRVKLKGRNDMEGTVGGYNVKDDGKLKSLVVRMDNGIRVIDFNLGVGFKDVERSNYLTEFPLGTTVTFSYRGFGENGKPKEARFVWVRRDDFKY